MDDDVDNLLPGQKFNNTNASDNKYYSLYIPWIENIYK